MYSHNHFYSKLSVIFLWLIFSRCKILRDSRVVKYFHLTFKEVIPLSVFSIVFFFFYSSNSSFCFLYCFFLFYLEIRHCIFSTQNNCSVPSSTEKSLPAAFRLHQEMNNFVAGFFADLQSGLQTKVIIIKKKKTEGKNLTMLFLFQCNIRALTS